MENRENFTYIYSAHENKEVQEIRAKYLPRPKSKLEMLKCLDKKVEHAGFITALVIGIIGTLIFGVGVCMGLEAIAGTMTGAIIIGSIGSATLITAYPVYRTLSQKAKKKYTPKILLLAEEISAGKNNTNKS